MSTWDNVDIFMIAGVLEANNTNVFDHTLNMSDNIWVKGKRNKNMGITLFTRPRNMINSNRKNTKK